jgi:hypothetical protein
MAHNPAETVILSVPVSVKAVVVEVESGAILQGAVVV